MVKIAGNEVGEIGYGLMGLTWRAQPPSQSQSFAAMRAALANGCALWNGGEIYGNASRNSLHLLNEYFAQYPSDASKVVLSIKGGSVPNGIMPDGSAQNVRRSIDECLKVLDGKKKLDLFECARVDPKTPIEESIRAAKEYVEKGVLGGITLSEVSAESIRRASKVHKIEFVEVEFSLWARDILENGVADVCKELGIPIVAYAPLGRGFLTGELKASSIGQGDFRSMAPRFQPGAFEQNMKLVDQLKAIAAKKGCKPSQLAIAWIRKYSGRDGHPEFIPIFGATTEERVKENTAPVQLTDSEFHDINTVLENVPIEGGRYPEAASGVLFGDSPPEQ
ncbi:MAG: Pyridoxine 4-dehydrogenase [Bogoriella megaspora]|nr:MAG: Pyridoxine 4-dehydrogenase [Bogoriella megaspora]